MNENDAIHYRSELEVVETDLQMQRFMVETAIMALDEYDRLIAEPGWSDLISYTVMVGVGVAIMTGAPAGLAGIAVYSYGLGTAIMGLYGAGAYTAQVTSRMFPGMPGASDTANIGGDMTNRVDAPLPATGSERYDHLEKFVVGKIVEKVTEKATQLESPGLPDHNTIQVIRDYFEDLKKWIERELEKNREKMGQPPTSGPTIGPPAERNLGPTNFDPLHQQNPVKVPGFSSNDDGGRPDFDHLRPEGGPYAGPDRPGRSGPENDSGHDTAEA